MALIPKKLLPRQNTSEIDKAALEQALAYIDQLWLKLHRTHLEDQGTLVGLPHPYLVPAEDPDASFRFEEQYYWDSYFTSIGLKPDTHQELIEGMLENLIYMLRRFGIVPNASRMYFTGHSQPPLLTTFIFYVYETYDKSNEWLRERIEVAEYEYAQVWMNSLHPEWHKVYKGLSRYYDINVLHDLAEAESGWDMTPRFSRKCLDFLPVDLNALLFKYETDFARAAQILGEKKRELEWWQAAETRKAAMRELMWSETKGFYFDYNYSTGKRGGVWSLAGFYPMWLGMVDEAQAARMVGNLDKFLKKGGLTTTTQPFIDTSMFGSLKTQWAYPNGWAPLQYIVIEALDLYGYYDDASLVAQRWLKTNLDWYVDHGVFQEKYNVVDLKKKPVEGVYPSQTGFGWTNAVFNYLAKKYL